MSAPDFEPFRKIPRLARKCTITEKLDGTNCSIWISEEGEYKLLRMASKNNWITVEKDHMGFAAWAQEHRDELLGLGVGRHYGEWWGSKIQRGYGLAERRFSLFNTGRWINDAIRPKCCHVVPVLWEGIFSTEAVDAQIERLRTLGSIAAPGFMKPEGVIIYHHADSNFFKKTLEKDEEPKSKVKNEN